MIRTLGFVLIVTGCTNTPLATQNVEHPQTWLTGCWESEDGSVREHWSEPEGGYLFGHAVTYRNGEAVFFEQLRIDPEKPALLNAYPAGEGPSAFPAIEQGEFSVVFANAAHDYPQRISYALNGDRLTASISLMDGSSRKDFEYSKCPKD